jgi:hypothetical protein
MVVSAMTDFLTFQSIVQYRVRVNDDGTIGSPEIMSKFTTAIKGSQHHKHRRVVRNLSMTDSTEEVLL